MFKWKKSSDRVKMKTNNLKKRIENINHYIGLASKLDDVVEEPGILNDIYNIVGILENSRKLYVFEIEGQQEDITRTIELNKSIGDLAEKVYGGNFQKARESIDSLDSNLSKDLLLYVRKAFSSGFLCVLTSPFSREVSKIHHNIYESYVSCTKSTLSAIKSKIKRKKYDREINKLKSDFFC